MNPNDGSFEKLNSSEGMSNELKSLRSEWAKHNIKKDQIFKVGEKVKIKECNYRVKAIHTKSITFEYWGRNI